MSDRLLAEFAELRVERDRLHARLVQMGEALRRESLRSEMAFRERDRLHAELRKAYENTHSEDVPMSVLELLNPGVAGSVSDKDRRPDTCDGDCGDDGIYCCDGSWDRPAWDRTREAPEPLPYPYDARCCEDGRELRSGCITCPNPLRSVSDKDRCPKCGAEVPVKHAQCGRCQALDQWVDPTDPCMSCGGRSGHHEPSCYFATYEQSRSVSDKDREP